MPAQRRHLAVGRAAGRRLRPRRRCARRRVGRPDPGSLGRGQPAARLGCLSSAPRDSPRERGRRPCHALRRGAGCVRGSGAADPDRTASMAPTAGCLVPMAVVRHGRHLGPGEGVRRRRLRYQSEDGGRAAPQAPPRHLLHQRRQLGKLAPRRREVPEEGHRQAARRLAGGVLARHPADRHPRSDPVSSLRQVPRKGL